MIIRREQPSDANAIRELFDAVYSETMFDEMRIDEARIPELSSIAL